MPWQKGQLRGPREQHLRVTWYYLSRETPRGYTKEEHQQTVETNVLQLCIAKALRLIEDLREGRNKYFLSNTIHEVFKKWIGKKIKFLWLYLLPEFVEKCILVIFIKTASTLRLQKRKLRLGEIIVGAKAVHLNVTQQFSPMPGRRIQFWCPFQHSSYYTRQHFLKPNGLDPALSWLLTSFIIRLSTSSINKYLPRNYYVPGIQKEKI